MGAADDFNAGLIEHVMQVAGFGSAQNDELNSL